MTQFSYNDIINIHIILEILKKNIINIYIILEILEKKLH